MKSKLVLLLIAAVGSTALVASAQTQGTYVITPDRPGGGGEYPLQDGFGWTNGVFLALVAKYGMPKE